MTTAILQARRMLFCVDNGVVVSQHAYVLDNNADLVPESVLARFVADKSLPRYKKCSNYRTIDEEVVFLGGGYVFQHFGHFLLEGVNRWWALLNSQYKNKKVVIALDKAKDIPVFVRKMLNAFGVVDKNIIVINKNTKFRKVFIPRQSTNIGVYVMPITRRVYDKLTTKLCDNSIQTYDKIYLSRGAMNDNRTFGERQIEKVFEKNGYKIIYPEKLPFEHQVTLVHNCRVMAGTAGSALHMAFFMKRGGTVIQIKRNSTISDNISIQQMINHVCGLNTILVAGSIETTPTEHFTTAPQIVGITPQMIKFFDDNKFKYNKSDIKIDQSEFARYLRQVRRYKIHMLYTKVIAVPIRVISAFGITKRGRACIGNFLRHIAQI